MSGKYFYKGVDLNIICNNFSGNVWQEQNSANKYDSLIPSEFGYQVNGVDLSIKYEAPFYIFYSNATNLNALFNASNNVNYLLFDAFNVILCGGGGGGGGGAGACFPSPGGSAGGGGGSGNASVFKNLVISYPSNNYILNIGSGGSGGSLGANALVETGRTLVGSNGDTGITGGNTKISKDNIDICIAYGGSGGIGGISYSSGGFGGSGGSSYALGYTYQEINKQNGNAGKDAIETTGAINDGNYGKGGGGINYYSPPDVIYGNGGKGGNGNTKLLTNGTNGSNGTNGYAIFVYLKK